MSRRGVPYYDVGLDGRFLWVRPQPRQPQLVTVMHVVLNWFEELKERVPTGRE